MFVKIHVPFIFSQSQHHFIFQLHTTQWPLNTAHELFMLLQKSFRKKKLHNLPFQLQSIVHISDLPTSNQHPHTSSTKS